MGNVKDLINKLRELADRGVDGERENAKRMLSKMVEKYQLTDQELEEDERDWRELTTKGDQDMFFVIVQNVIHKWDNRYRQRKGEQKIWIYCTKAEQLEIEFKASILIRAYKEQKKILRQAFMMKNKLWANTGVIRDWDELTPEEKEEYRKTILMATGMEKVQIHKAIEQ